MRILLLLMTFPLIMCSCAKDARHIIDLSGEWKFRSDPLDQGITEAWFGQELPEKILLPGSMTENGKGDDISMHTKWTGYIVDSAWYYDDKYAPYRKDGNIKLPYWLQPEKHYVGAAWYQKVVEIPADWEGKSIILNLERPHWETQVWVDDQSIGMQNSLSAPHIYDLTDKLVPGQHTLTIRIDNRVKDFNPGLNSHAITDHTQTNWNGMVGKMTLEALAPVTIRDIRTFPDVEGKQVSLKISIRNYTGERQECSITVMATDAGDRAAEKIPELTQIIQIDDAWSEIEIVYPMGESPLLWDEHDPNLYTINVKLESPAGMDQKQALFGMREFKADGTRFTINGRPLFLRGTLECCIFPKTGYPAMDVDEWKRILNVCKAHGLNHMRFHSWCPPEAAFIAADQEGIYLQVEGPAWAHVGSGDPIDRYLMDESKRIVKAYGNHPSFVMMAYGNEPGGANMNAWLTDFVSYWKKTDDRRLYTSAAGWPILPVNDYHNMIQPRIQGWGEGLSSIINARPPRTSYDWSNAEAMETPWDWGWRNRLPDDVIPVVSHEVGQWCAYPNFAEAEKYTGVLKAEYMDIFRETLNENDLGHLAHDFLMASGKLQALCYKADIEAALRTPGFAGFQLLDLHDFPGYGTSLVGVVDPFWEEKGYISPEEFRRFCNVTVPLARMEKLIFNNNETFVAGIEVSHAGAARIEDPVIQWKIESRESGIIASGEFQVPVITIDNAQPLGKVELPLFSIHKPEQLYLSVSINDFENGWDFWVYPSKLPEVEGDIHIASVFDQECRELLEEGGTVLLTLKKGSLAPEFGGDIAVGFSSIFWNTSWTAGQAPHTLGILCDPGHPALSEFPTEYHSDFQWWDAMSHSNAIILDRLSEEPQPVVRVIDDWFENRNLALIFEARVGKGKILVSGIDLLSDMENRPEARQILYSLRKYMDSDAFNPETAILPEELNSLTSKSLKQ